jgi:acetyl-CoA C-acetyltransferase
VEKVLTQAGMTIADIDVLELNEAFAAQVVPCRDEWGIDHESSTRSAARSRSATRSA